MSQPNRHELEKRWRERWQAAKLKLELATVRVGEIEREMRGTARPGVSQAHREALEAENTALREYSQVLRIYTDLVVHGKIPDEPADDPQQCKTDNAGVA